MNIYKLLFVIISLTLASSYSLYATTYVFWNNESFNYNDLANWQNSDYPGPTIMAGDTVIINGVCAYGDLNISVGGVLEFRSEFFGRSDITVQSSGKIINNGISFENVNVEGAIEGAGAFSSGRVTCQGCTISPGGGNGIGTITISDLQMEEGSTINIDIQNNSFDRIKGRDITGNGVLVLNFNQNNQIAPLCRGFQIFDFENTEVYSFSDILFIPMQQSNFQTNVTDQGLLTINEEFEGDRALDFGRHDSPGGELYAAVDNLLDTIRTIEFRLYPESMTIPESRGMVMGLNAAIDQYVFFGENNTNLNRGQEILAVVNGGRMYVQNDTASGSILSHDWHHYAIVDENEDGKYDHVYIDNSSYEVKGTLADVFVVEELLLGRRNSASSPLNFNGRIDEVRLWNVTRQFPEIFNNNNCSLEPSDTVGLVAYYKMDQGIGQGDNCDKRLYDSSGKNNHGSIESNFDLLGPIANWVDLSHCPDYGTQIQNEDRGDYEGTALFWNNNFEWRQGIPEACHDVSILSTTHIEVKDKNARCILLQVDSSSIFSVEQGVELNVFGLRN